MAVIIGTPDVNPPPSLDGTPFSDLIRGLGGNDLIRGLGGDDRLDGGTGADRLYGGAGNDLSVWSDGDGWDFFDGGPGIDTQRAYGAADAGEQFDVDVSGNEALLGRPHLRSFRITLRDVETLEVHGRGGDDTLNVHATAGTALTSIVFHGDDGNDVLYGGLTTIPVTAFGGAGADKLGGSASDDVLDGGSGDDTFFGGQGNDTISGGTGNDLNTGSNGTGTDVFDGGVGTDTQEVSGYDIMDADVFTVGASGDRVVVAQTNLDPFRATLVNVEALVVNGTRRGDDTLTVGSTEGTSLTSVRFIGSRDNNVLDGTTATVPIIADGDEGRDRLRGGLGDDTLSGGSGDNMLWGGPGADRLTGSVDTDLLFGEAGNDDLRGGSGWDTLRGGSGDDLLVGGGGWDTFVYEFSPSQRTGLDGNDTIQDFERFVDVLLLDTDEAADIRGERVLRISDDGSNVIIGFVRGGGQITLLGLGNGTIDTVNEARRAGIDIFRGDSDIFII